ncbi:MAG: phytoene desaturase [Bacteroidales bacterium]|nr:phytoene desaturase [Bacteroidales bacterium]MCF8402934.1 phytoene desaturase [Bacteroidales bacterium]
MNQKKVIVIGAGFSGLSAACFLARDGYEVTVVEKNSSPGGRARQFSESGFTFDMGPSWYWMPDVFDRFFNEFGKRTEDYYKLIRLDPSYRIYWRKGDATDLPASYTDMRELFESIEKGAALKLDKFLAGAEYKYKIGINKLVYKKSSSPLEFLDTELLSGMFKLNVFNSFHQHVRKYFRHPKLIQMLEFPVLFLGATPKETPALYSLMNYGDIKLGTWYPEGGIYSVIEAMVNLAKSLGVKFEYNHAVKGINIENNLIKNVSVNGHSLDADIFVGSADYNHIEQELIGENFRKYNASYWGKRTMSPSALIFYLGINKRIPGILHHTLFFDEDFKKHAAEIYDDPQWPEKPSIYVSATSKTDTTVAPEGMENLMVLIPVASGLKDDEETRNRYFDYIINKLENFTGESIRKHVIYKRSYAHADFKEDYNAFQGNAYGLANTLMQTAFLKPKMQSKKVKNLFYTGQLTVPGPGVPPAIISGQVAATEVVKQFKN